MAQFYGTLRGQRESESTKCGTKASGLRGTVRGWNIGATAYMAHSETHGDMVSLYLDGGSNGARSAFHILTVGEHTTRHEIAEQLRDIADRIESGSGNGWES